MTNRPRYRFIEREKKQLLSNTDMSDSRTGRRSPSECLLEREVLRETGAAVARVTEMDGAGGHDGVEDENPATASVHGGIYRRPNKQAAKIHSHSHRTTSTDDKYAEYDCVAFFYGASIAKDHLQKSLVCRQFNA